MTRAEFVSRLCRKFQSRGGSIFSEESESEQMNRLLYLEVKGYKSQKRALLSYNFFQLWKWPQLNRSICVYILYFQTAYVFFFFQYQQSVKLINLKKIQVFTSSNKYFLLLNCSDQVQNSLFSDFVFVFVLQKYDSTSINIFIMFRFIIFPLTTLRVQQGPSYGIHNAPFLPNDGYMKKTDDRI